MRPQQREDEANEWGVRCREKVMRGLKKADTKILPGYQIYHNYPGRRLALNGMTPAEKCGIILKVKTSGKQ